MKLVRFGEKGSERPGLVDREGTIRDLSGIIEDIAGSALLPEGLARLSALDAASLPAAARGVRLGPCVARVGKIIGIGLNYSDHAAEVGRPLPSEPSFFLKASSSITGPTDAIEIPRGSDSSDWEVELGLVIGVAGKYISESAAMDHVAGFCTGGDISERRVQAKEGPGCAKSFDTFTPLGPWLVTRDELTDAGALGLTTDVDGRRYQNGNTSGLVFKVPQVIAYMSRYFTLETGDVILTGTPAGVGKGQKPSKYLSAGNRLVIAVEGLGTQEHAVIAG